MNLNVSAVVTFLAGVILMYSSVKNKYPLDVIREALGKKPLSGPISLSPADYSTQPPPMDRPREPAPSTPRGTDRSFGKGTPNPTV